MRQWRAHGWLFAAALAILVPSQASSQAPGFRSTIRDIAIGVSINALPPDFQEFACGTNGGPPSLPITSFVEFASCPADTTGLHEVQFRYDDEVHYVALAQHDPLRAELFQGTKIGNFPIVASVLVDDSGIVRGIRAVTDDRVPNSTRRAAHSMAQYVRLIYASSQWDCVDTPAAEGETPVGNLLIRQDCQKLDGGLFYMTEARLLRRPGQTLIDPVNGLPRAGYWESTARLEIYQVDDSGNLVHDDRPAPDPIAMTPNPVPSDPVDAFLMGVTNDCPGCDLSGAQLQRRNLAGADLAGANLSNASLHRTLLGGADLRGANLVGANLNLADLKRASLVGSDLSGTLMYQTDAAAADFSRAILDSAEAENARFTGATMVGVHWRSSYAVGANLAGADLSGAILIDNQFQDADFQRAQLGGADLTDAWLFRARFRAADLTDATALRANFLQADLSDAILVNANLAGAQLLRARSDGMDLTGAILVGTILPDGSLGQ